MRVTGPDGQPLKAVPVRLSAGPGPSRARTDASGTAHFSGLFPDVYSVSFETAAAAPMVPNVAVACQPRA